MGGYIGAKTGTLVASASDIRGDISATDTTPEITLKNTTETDADGTRSGKITFKGEQSGGEESVLAQIQGSHDGTADDEKGDLIFKTNDGSDGASPTERLKIDSTGNVGVSGSTKTTALSSAAHFDTLGLTVDDNTAYDNVGIGGGIAFRGKRNSSGTQTVFGAIDVGKESAANDSYTGSLRFYTNNNSTGIPTEHMLLHSTGTLQIGSSTNAGYGPLQIGSTSLASPIMQFLSTTTGNNTIHFGDATSGAGRYAGYLNYRHNGDSFEIATAGGERMRIDSSGVFMVGKTASDGGVVGFEVRPDGETFTTKSSGNTLFVHDTSSNKFYVNANGGIYNYQANNVNLSDQREKKNIEALGSKWDAVKAWIVKEFHYNADEDSDSKKLGVIAQDLETNHPELVSDFILNPAQKEVIDEDGDVTTEAADAVTRKSVKEQQMMWMAIKALQEAMAKIETLEAQNTTQATQIADLITRVTALEAG